LDAGREKPDPLEIARASQLERRARRRNARKQASGRIQHVAAGSGEGSIPTAAAFLSVRQLAQRWSVGTATIWRWSAEGVIPKPLHLSEGTTRWAVEEIKAHEMKLRGGC
jgi:prophage regulatory protein